jgi:hypothetical protein
MTGMVEEWLVYNPPKSVSFGHTSTPRDPRKAWPIVEKFLGSLANVELGHSVELTCHEGGKWTDIAIAERRIEEAKSLFGAASNPQDAYPRWSISSEQVSSAVRFALDDDRYPKQEIGPVSFHCYYRFLWPEFEQRPYWASKNDTRPRSSSLGITVGGRRLFLQPTLVFPAPWSSDYLREYLVRVEQTIPFRFRDQYFKRWIPAKKSGYGRFLNLPASWRASRV